MPHRADLQWSEYDTLAETFPDDPGKGHAGGPFRDARGRIVLRAEIGTTGDVRRFVVGMTAARDVAEACEREHICSDSHCDIRAALQAGFPFTAAHLLGGATETPLLDAVLAFWQVTAEPDGWPEDWAAWGKYHDEHARTCPRCEAFNYPTDDVEPESCSQCGADWTTEPNPEREGQDRALREMTDGEDNGDGYHDGGPETDSED